MHVTFIVYQKKKKDYDEIIGPFYTMPYYAPKACKTLRTTLTFGGLFELEHVL